MAETQLDISTKKAIDELKALQAEIVKTGDVVGDTKKDIDDAFKVGAATGMAAAIDDLQKEFQQLERSAKTLRSALKNTTDPKLVELYRTNIERLEQGMKKLETTGKAVGVNVRQLNKEAGLGKQVFTEFFGAFTKVALIVEAIRLVSQFVVASVNLAEQTRKAQLQFEAFTGSAEKAGEIVADLTALATQRLLNVDEVLQAGKGLLAFGESAENLVPVLGRIADISAATGKNFNELSIIYGKARAAGVLYAEDINQLVDAGIPIIREFAKQLGVSESEVKKLASEGKISFEELQLAFFNLTAAGGKFAEQSKINADSIGGAWQRLVNTVRPAMEAIGKEFSEATKFWLNVTTNAVEGIKRLFGVDPPKLEADLADREELRQDRAAYEAELKERERVNKEAVEARKRLRSKNAKEAEALERERQRAIIDGMAEGMQKEIAIENARFSELKKRLDKFHLDTEEAERQHRVRLLQIQLKYYESAASEQEAAEAAAKEQLTVEADTPEEALKKQFDAAQKALELEKEIFEGFLLERQKNFNAENEISEKTAEQRKAFDENMAAAREEFQLIVQKKEVENLLEFGQFQSETEKQILEQRLANIKEAIAQLGTGAATPEGKKPFDLLEFLGVDDKSRDEFERAVSQIVDGINKITQARLDAARAAVEAANEQVRAAEDAVDAAEEKLDREIEIAKTGEANNLALREQELAAAEQQAAAAKKIREDAIKEQQKAAKAQLIVDSATQVSSIVTATANIFKSFSSFPIVGLALAAAQIASMIALFASIRARAKAITAQKLKRGGEVEGRDRVTGQPDSDGEILVRATPGEFVTNKRQSQKHRPLLEAINAGDVPKMALYLEGIKTGGRRDVAATAGVAGGVSVSVNATDPKLRDLMAKNNALQKRIFELEKNKAQVFDMGDHILRIKGGRRERIKKQQRW